jgi:hypothetical protein
MCRNGAPFHPYVTQGVDQLRNGSLTQVGQRIRHVLANFAIGVVEPFD